MISAEVGFIPNVTGIRSAMPAEGPIPGSTPMIVPRKTPMKVYQRLIGCRQTANPLMMCVKVSTVRPLKRQYPAREIHAENLHEHDVTYDREEHRGEHVRDPVAAIKKGHQAQKIDRGREDVAKTLEYQE